MTTRAPGDSTLESGVCAREDGGGVRALGLLLQAGHAQVGHLDRHRVLRVPLLARAAALHAMHASDGVGDGLW